MAVKRKRRISSPPQKHLRIPTLRKLGEVSRPVMITIVTVLALALLAVLLLFSSQFVGKAYSGIEGTAGLTKITSANEGSQFVLSVDANIGTEKAVAISFDLQMPNNLPSGTNCDSLVESTNVVLGWTGANLVDQDFSCVDDSTLRFTYSTLNFAEAKTGNFQIAHITFNGLPAGDYEFGFSDLKVLAMDQAGTTLISSGEALTVIVQEVQQPQCQVDADCPSAGSAYCSNDQSCGTTITYACQAGQCVEDQVISSCDACPTGEACQLETGLCAPTPVTSCTQNSDCTENEYCSETVCMDKIADGGHCTADDACFSNNCDLDTEICQATEQLPTEPTTCISTSQCNEGRICNINGQCATPLTCADFGNLWTNTLMKNILDQTKYCDVDASACSGSETCVDTGSSHKLCMPNSYIFQLTNTCSGEANYCEYKTWDGQTCAIGEGECNSGAECGVNQCNLVTKTCVSADEQLCSTNNDCTGGNTCQEGSCQTPSMMSVKVYPQGLTVSSAVTALSKARSYVVEASLIPTVSLTKHIFFIKLTDANGRTLLSHYERDKPALFTGSQEVVSFNYQLPDDAVGPVRIKAFVWTDFLAASGQVIEGSEAEGEYAIQ